MSRKKGAGIPPQAKAWGLLPEDSMIGRGTRVCEEYDKFTFDIIDYTGTSFKHFADPDFDGEPIAEDEEIIETGDKQNRGESTGTTGPSSGGQKFYVDEGEVTIAEDRSPLQRIRQNRSQQSDKGYSPQEYLFVYIEFRYVAVASGYPLLNSLQQ